MSMTIGDPCTGCTACTRSCPVDAIRGEKKSLHVVEQLKCIECGACGRVCPSGAVVDGEGRTVERLMPRTAWSKPVFDLSLCISCAACRDKCPVSCIELSAGKPGGIDGWPRLSQPHKCVSCGYCAFYCPVACIEIREPARDAAREESIS